MKDQLKEILLKQLQLLQEACERDMTDTAMAEISKALAEALAVATVTEPTGPLMI